MKLEVFLKQMLGIILLAFLIEFPRTFEGNNIILNALLKIPFWICVFVFFKWNDWVNYEQQIKEKRK